MKIRKILFVTLIISLFLFLYTGCFNNKVLATYSKNKKLTLNEALDEYKELSIEGKSRITGIEECFRFVRKLALEKIILEKAKKIGLENDKSIKERLEKSRKYISYEILKKKNITDKIEIKAGDYERYSKRFKLYHIVKRTDIFDEKKVEDSKKLLNRIALEIKNLDMFKDYAKKYSDDGVAGEGGFIGNIRLGIMEDNIDREIKDLPPAKVSKIIESSMGIHIFYIESIDKAPLDELYKDKDLYELIYNEKKNALEEKWYAALLKDSSLKLNTDLVKQKISDDKVIISYKSKKMTRKEFFEIVEQYRQGIFPEATYDELVKLMKNISIDMIMEEKSESGNITGSGDYKKRFQREKEFLMINEYIDRNVVKAEINDAAIKDFYEKNKSTLFTFKQPSGVNYIQPVNEVKEFIKQKIDEKNKQDNRYNLYRKIVDEEKLVIDDKVLEDFKKSIKI